MEREDSRTNAAPSTEAKYCPKLIVWAIWANEANHISKGGNHLNKCKQAKGMQTAAQKKAFTALWEACDELESLDDSLDTIEVAINARPSTEGSKENAKAALDYLKSDLDGDRGKADKGVAAFDDAEQEGPVPSALTDMKQKVLSKKMEITQRFSNLQKSNEQR